MEHSSTSWGLLVEREYFYVHEMVTFTQCVGLFLPPPFSLTNGPMGTNGALVNLEGLVMRVSGDPSGRWNVCELV